MDDMIQRARNAIIEYYYKRIVELQQRIDKAKEYILNHELVDKPDVYVLDGKYLLDILRGDK